MPNKAIDKLWYENEGAGYTIGSVDFSTSCFANEGDEISIEFVYPPLPSPNEQAVLLKYQNVVSGTPAYYAEFWANACSGANGDRAQYNPKLGVIQGKGSAKTPEGTQTRWFSIALDRSITSKPFRIHVYVAAREQGGGAPDDGSWTGNGR